MVASGLPSSPALPQSATADVSNGQNTWILFNQNNNPIVKNLGVGVTTQQLYAAIINAVGMTYCVWRSGGNTNPFTTADYTVFGLTGGAATAPPVLNITQGLRIV